jgi:hypothetical protein
MHARVEAAGGVVLIDAGAKKIDALSAFRFRGGGVELAHRGLMMVCRCAFRAHDTALMGGGGLPPEKQKIRIPLSRAEVNHAARLLAPFL